MVDATVFLSRDLSAMYYPLRGPPMPDGSLRVASLTHRTIAEFVGTSREIVTFQMNRLRRIGLVRYSREDIDVYAQAPRENLRQHGRSVPHGAKGATKVCTTLPEPTGTFY
jgi:hypothetical protein